MVLSIYFLSFKVMTLDGEELFSGNGLVME